MCTIVILGVLEPQRAQKTQKMRLRHKTVFNAKGARDAKGMKAECAGRIAGLRDWSILGRFGNSHTDPHGRTRTLRTQLARRGKKEEMGGF